MRKAIHSVYSRNVTSGPEMSYCLTKYMCIRYEAKYAFNETVLIDINGSVTPSRSAAAAPAASCLFLQSNFHPPPPDIIWIASVCRIPTAT